MPTSRTGSPKPKGTATITRLYITRLHGGGGQLLVDHTPRPAMKLLAGRERYYAAGQCD